MAGHTELVSLMPYVMLSNISVHTRENFRLHPCFVSSSYSDTVEVSWDFVISGGLMIIRGAGNYQGAEP